MSGNPTITAALITRDEQRNLEELLPVLDWTDEIVIVDGGSRDATVRIARSHGCRVVSRRFDGFAGQRNHALGLATGDWVLSIDADERPGPRLVAEIHRRIADSRPDAYRVPIRSRIFRRRMRYGGTQDDCPVRLFRRGAARWTGDVHEVLRVRGRIGRLQNWLTHETIPNLETFLAKMHRYTHLEAKARVAAARLEERGEVPLVANGTCPPFFQVRWQNEWIAAAREVFRRLIYKQGLLDGPAGWAFGFLSGLSEWVLAREHRRLTKGDRSLLCTPCFRPQQQKGPVPFFPQFPQQSSIQEPNRG